MSTRHPLQYKFNTIRAALRSPSVQCAAPIGSTNTAVQLTERSLQWTLPAQATPELSLNQALSMTSTRDTRLEGSIKVSSVLGGRI